MSDKDTSDFRKKLLAVDSREPPQNNLSRIFDDLEKKIEKEAPTLKLPGLKNGKANEGGKEFSISATPKLPFMTDPSPKSRDNDANASHLLVPPEGLQKRNSDEDFGLSLMNRLSGLREETPSQQTGQQVTIDTMNRLARQQSFLKVIEFDNEPSKHKEAVPQHESYKHFGYLADFLMKFFKSEPIAEEDLKPMNSAELEILKSFVSRKFNKNIKVKSAN